jgi:hypothetical protein
MQLSKKIFLGLLGLIEAGLFMFSIVTVTNLYRYGMEVFEGPMLTPTLTNQYPLVGLGNDVLIQGWLGHTLALVIWIMLMATFVLYLRLRHTWLLLVNIALLPLYFLTYQL